ncbi:zinc finger matrin-type protein 1 isoform X2 [Brachyhypopomus gauderio]|uniref:zinc finger matrin-type protein 1 isoform X2 n=1 Tax=Brachyhypopomus gauderio TaxID=698409 RepID=UPI0040413BF9
MSVLEGSVSYTESNAMAHSDSASVLDAETVQNTNTPSCHVEEETLNESELLKGLLTDSFCQVCEAVLLFESQRVSHYEGKKHAQRVRIYLQTKKAERQKQRQEFGGFQSANVGPDKFCELCNMVFSSAVVARSHYEGKVHAKNMRKTTTAPSVDVRSTVGSPVPTGCAAPQGETDQEPKESTVSAPQGVDLSNPDKYCKLCTASFNNPLMARQHYSGRKHQRNQARQELLCKLGEESEHVHSLTCPVCCVTLGSIETYQAHMQGNKHHVKEKKIVGLCKSQKKVYGSFQDELADYIQVQRARGLEPKTRQGPEGPAHRTAEEDVKDAAEEVEDVKEAQACPSAPSSHAPPPSLHPPQWHQPFHPRITQFAFSGKFPVQQQWNQGCPSQPPPLVPGLTGRSLHRGRSPDSFSSSSFSDSSSSSYSSSSRSSSEDSREGWRRRRRGRGGGRGRREQDSDSVKDTDRSRRRKDEEERGPPKKARRLRRMSFGEEQVEQGVDEDPERRKRKQKRPRGRDSDDSEDYGRKKRAGKGNKRSKEGHYGKRWRGEDKGGWSKVSVEERVEGGGGGGSGEGEPAVTEGHLGDRPEPDDERSKCKREKKRKTKEKTDKGDTRTEEEKLWDETILGIF